MSTLPRTLVAATTAAATVFRCDLLDATNTIA